MTDYFWWNSLCVVIKIQRSFYSRKANSMYDSYEECISIVAPPFFCFFYSLCRWILSPTDDFIKPQRIWSEVTRIIFHHFHQTSGKFTNTFPNSVYAFLNPPLNEIALFTQLWAITCNIKHETHKCDIRKWQSVILSGGKFLKPFDVKCKYNN